MTRLAVPIGAHCSAEAGLGSANRNGVVLFGAPNLVLIRCYLLVHTIVLYSLSFHFSGVVVEMCVALKQFGSYVFTAVYASTFQRTVLDKPIFVFCVLCPPKLPRLS